MPNPGRLCLWFSIAAAGCVDRPVFDDTHGQPGTGTSGGPPADTGPPTTTAADPDTGATSEPPGTTGVLGTGEASTSTGPGADTTTGGGTSSGEPGGSSESGESGESTGGASTCGPPCAETWVHQGDLTISWVRSTEEFACMVGVTGVLQVNGDLDAAALSGLRNLQSVARLQLEFNEVLADLSPFACLEQAPEGLQLYQMPALVDVSALSGLRSAVYVAFEQTGVVAMPAFAPDFTGVENVYLRHNPALVDLSAMAGWGDDAGDYLAIQIDDNAELPSLVGIEGPIAAADDATVAVQVTAAPKLTSLAGLETMTRGSLWLQGLPLVEDMLPLAALTEGYNITLFDMPAVTSLQGLHNLATVQQLMIGDCITNQPGTPGMDGLVDLSGLDALTTADSLSIANNANLTALAGAPLLTTVSGLEVIENVKLPPAKVDEFIAQLTSMPTACVGGWDMCTCFDIMPW